MAFDKMPFPLVSAGNGEAPPKSLIGGFRPGRISLAPDSDCILLNLPVSKKNEYRKSQIQHDRTANSPMECAR